MSDNNIDFEPEGYTAEQLWHRFGTAIFRGWAPAPQAISIGAGGGNFATVMARDVAGLKVWAGFLRAGDQLTLAVEPTSRAGYVYRKTEVAVVRWGWDISVYLGEHVPVEDVSPQLTPSRGTR